MKLENGKTIAESLEPTFENVTREFITNTLYKLLFSSEIPNIKFDFREKEAISFIEETLQNYRNSFNDEELISELKLEHKKILDSLKQKPTAITEIPVMTINDYKKFFELLRQIYEKDIELFFKDSELSGFQVKEKDNLFEQIWLRCTPEDFRNPELFLDKQNQMIHDKTFDKYDNETCIGKMDFFADNVLCIKNGIARTWDENSREFEIIIYDKNHYADTDLLYKPHYTLPVIRYGIYNMNGKKVCYIGSIQNKNLIFPYTEQDLDKNVNRTKFRVNAGVPKELTDKVEPNAVLALSIFINLLHKEGITEFEIPCTSVLSYEYEKRLIANATTDLNQNWTEERKKSRPLAYEIAKKFVAHNQGKEDLIREIKTDGFLKKFNRILYHYPKGTVNSYPSDYFLRLNIPIVNNENEIKGELLQQFYKLINSRTLETER